MQMCQAHTRFRRGCYWVRMGQGQQSGQDTTLFWNVFISSLFIDLSILLHNIFYNVW